MACAARAAPHADGDGLEVAELASGREAQVTLCDALSDAAARRPGSAGADGGVRFALLREDRDAGGAGAAGCEGRSDHSLPLSDGHSALVGVEEDEHSAVGAVLGSAVADPPNDAVGAGLSKENKAPEDDEEDCEVQGDSDKELPAHQQGFNDDLRGEGVSAAWCMIRAKRIN